MPVAAVKGLSHAAPLTGGEIGIDLCHMADEHLSAAFGARYHGTESSSTEHHGRRDWMILTSLSLAIGSVLMVLAITQSAAAAGFLRCLRRGLRPDRPAPSTHPKAAVILALRGPDPLLESTLEGLGRQDYGNYSVHLAFDSREDSALPVVERFMETRRLGNFHLHFPEQRKDTCSLKCGIIAWTVRRIEADREVVAFIDADAPPHPRWLADLVAPLDSLSVGVVTGNRWYLPPDTRWGTIVRYLWNAAAVVQVWFNRIAWAGSMAMRAETAKNPELLRAWERSLSVDATVTRFARDLNLEIHFAPAVIIPNRESIGISRFWRWSSRQVVAARQSGSGWLTIGLHALVLPALQPLALTLLVISLVSGRETSFFWLAAGLGAYWGSNLIALSAIEVGIRKVLRHTGYSLPPFSLSVFVRLLPGMFMSLAVALTAFLWSCFQKRVSWRGIEYAVGRKGTIRMIEYRPFVAEFGRKKEESVI